jgi:hypothetical protein
VTAFGAADFRLGVPFLIDPPVKILKEGQVRGEEVLDEQFVNGPGGAEPDDRTGQQQDGEVGRVAVHPRIGLCGDLVPRGRQAQDAFPVQDTLLVDVAARQYERVLGEQPGPRAGRLLTGGQRRSRVGHRYAPYSF